MQWGKSIWLLAQNLLLKQTFTFTFTPQHLRGPGKCWRLGKIFHSLNGHKKCAKCFLGPSLAQTYRTKSMCDRVLLDLAPAWSNVPCLLNCSNHLFLLGATFLHLKSESYHIPYEVYSQEILAGAKLSATEAQYGSSNYAFSMIIPSLNSHYNKGVCSVFSEPAMGI